jgi:hypothetical protein
MSGSDSRRGLPWWANVALWGAVLAVTVAYVAALSGNRPTRMPTAERAPVSAENRVAGPLASTKTAAAVGNGKVPSELTLIGVPSPPERDEAPALAEPLNTARPWPAASPRAAPSSIEALRTGPVAPPLVLPGETPSSVRIVTLRSKSTHGAGPTGVAAGAARPASASMPPIEKTTIACDQTDAVKKGSESESTTSNQVNHAEAQAFAKAVLSAPSTPAAKEAKPVAGEAPKVTTNPPAAPKPPPTPGQGVLTQGQARILGEYEAMRRAAEEAMRRRWLGPGMPPPPGGPYGFYPYPPGYYYPPPR